MKRNIHSISKRKAIIASIIAAVLLCCIIISGCMLFRGENNHPASAATPTSTLTVTADKTTLEPGGEITLTYSFHNTRSGEDWFSMQATLTPLNNDGTVNYDLLNALSLSSSRAPRNLDSKFIEYSGGAASHFVSNLDEYDEEDRGIFVYAARGQNDYVQTQEADIPFQVTLKLADNYTGASSFKFGFTQASSVENFVITVPHATANPKTKDTPEAGTFVLLSTPTITVGSGGGTNPGPGPSQSSDYSISLLTVVGNNNTTYLSRNSVGDYTVTVPNSVTSATINVTTSDSNATVVGAGSKTLSVGTNGPYKVYAVAEDGSNSTGTQAYNITIVRESSSTPPGPSQSNDYEITSLKVVGDNGTTYFTQTNLGTYTVTVPYSVSSADINVITSDSNATVVGDGNKTLTVGANGPYKVYAVAEDGSNSAGTDAYNVTIVRRTQPIEGATLISIKVDGVEIRDFDPEIFDYTVYVDSTNDYPRVTATASDSTVPITMYENGTLIDTNEGEITDRVELSTLGASSVVRFEIEGKIYTVQITRASEQPYLTYLKVGNYQITDANGRVINGENENAVKNVFDFYVTIENADTLVNVIARASSPSALIYINSQDGEEYTGSVASLFNNPDDPAHADIQIAIRPMYGQGPIIIHNLHLTRKPSLSGSTKVGIFIKEITTEHEKNKVDFNSEYAQYGDLKVVYGMPYYVPYNVASLTVEIYPEEQGKFVAPPTYQIFYGETLKNNNGVDNPNVHLNYGVNVVLITILSSDGSSSKSIPVIVWRDEPSLFPNPNILEIPEFMNEYSADVTNYAYTVGNDVTKLTVQYLNWDKNLYSCSVNGADKLNVGLNTVTICLYEINQGANRTAASVNSPDAVRTITLSVYREASTASTIWLILFIIFLILAILEFIILLILLLRRRNDDDSTTRVVVSTPAPAPAPAPVVRMQQPVAPVQYVSIPQPQPQVQYVPVPQPVVQEKSQQPVNVEVKITGCGESDGYYKTKNNRS